MKLEDAFSICSGNTKPFLPVVRSAHIIVWPTGWKSGFSCIENGKCAILILRTCESEMKPLQKIRIGILADFQLDIIFSFIESNKLNVATVEIGSDFHNRRR